MKHILFLKRGRDVLDILVEVKKLMTSYIAISISQPAGMLGQTP